MYIYIYIYGGAWGCVWGCMHVCVCMYVVCMCVVCVYVVCACVYVLNAFDMLFSLLYPPLLCMPKFLTFQNAAQLSISP